ncbi:Replication-associated recombination protein A [Candidatus Izimaplasma bacterium HR1]|jgi:putative ATPase|uniref:replication-associated recombination protein A n=1 Tax=Candidatus Izimoplasma sp. HR1 TaxID=1541959 RepID=UPI0004F5FD43|nr:Replication-associated recombination protein A [Candidatus Izimaplasma bacterium HR1]
MEIKRPLAYRARPKNLNEVVGQDHILGKNGVIKRMIDNEKLFSLILYGPPGIGKTTIAEAIGEIFGLRTYKFNASTDRKSQLSEIIKVSKNYGALLIVDEIHRMNKDVQDYLLPHVEEGNVIMIGLTTNNPYHSVNPAVRSRTHVLKLKSINKDDIIERLKQVEIEFKDELGCKLDDVVYEYIAMSSNNEIRTAINSLEILNMSYPNEEINLEKAKNVLLSPSLSLDKNEDNYFNILSALQKSIRGSDVDASLHYLARLVAMEDLTSILRRLTVIAWEDIGLANPAVVTRMDACARACERVGFPEARIPLGTMVVDLALSPKSNSAHSALDDALKEVMEGKTPKVPNHIINVANFEDKTKYKYPHDYDNALVYQQYLPDELKDKVYYYAKETGKYERALNERNKIVKKVLKKTK